MIIGKADDESGAWANKIAYCIRTMYGVMHDTEDLLSLFSGEDAFYYLQIPVAWAKRPMLKRIDSGLDPSVPISFIYGNRSWMDPSSGEKVRELRPLSYVRIYRIARAGHHVHADRPEEFNQTVNNVLKIVDRNKDLVNDERSASGNSSEDESKATYS